MSRIASAFGPRPGLVAYLTMGDPDLDTSVEAAVALADAGASVLELGVPFSDPIADGPVIARAAHRAIAGGATLEGVLHAAERIRSRTSVPLVLMTYLNPLFSMGDEGAVGVRRAKDVGVDGVLFVDLPGDVETRATQAAKDAGLDRIVLVAPTTTPARRAAILANAGGFVYVVTVTGVTGASAIDTEEVRRAAAAARASSGLPTAVGFGIDTAAKAAAMVAPPRAGAPDGVIVGTAIVKAIEAASTPEARVAAARAVVAEIRAALG